MLADQVDAVYAEMRALSSAEVGNEFRVELAERLETQERTNRGLMYRVFGEIADPPDEAAMVPVLADKLWARLRIPPREIKRRMKMAARIRPRRELTGPPLAPELPYVAAALEAGTIGEDHLRAICRAIDVLPSAVSMVDRGDVEASLVREAAKSDVEIVKAVARRIDEIFNPDGDFDEADRARRRGLHLGVQGRDGMSRLSGFIDPETRAYVEAVTAAVRPGRHLPDGTLVETRDERSGAQRCHDGIKLGLKAGIASGGLGSHRGHPVTVIVRTTLAELNQAAHDVSNPDVPMPAPARTGGDTALPMRDVIRMGADGIHYLAVFDDHSERPIYLGRQNRIATADQRIICYAYNSAGLSGNEFTHTPTLSNTRAKHDRPALGLGTKSDLWITRRQNGNMSEARARAGAARLPASGERVIGANRDDARRCPGKPGMHGNAECSLFVIDFEEVT